jgi:hypothetical protein
MTTQAGNNQVVQGMLDRQGQRQNYQQQAQNYIRQLLTQHAVGQQQMTRNPLDPARMSDTSTPSLTPQQLFDIQRQARIQSPIDPMLVNWFGNQKAYQRSDRPKNVDRLQQRNEQGGGVIPPGMQTMNQNADRVPGTDPSALINRLLQRTNGVNHKMSPKTPRPQNQLPASL